jgi:hypothetical protein
MNKNQFLIAVSAIIVLVTLMLFSGHPLRMMTNNPISTVQSSTVPATPNSQGVFLNEYHVNAPNALMLVDSQGRRTGKNPATGLVYHEIPNTAYSEESNTPGHRTGELFFSVMPTSQYTLFVLGGPTGSFTLDAQVYQPFILRQTISGTVKLGFMDGFSINTNVATLTSSTLLSPEGATTSTARITGVPPHNLPPPAHL